jgi:hypothetical protein
MPGSGDHFDIIFTITLLYRSHLNIVAIGQGVLYRQVHFQYPLV